MNFASYSANSTYIEDKFMKMEKELNCQKPNANTSCLHHL